MEKQNNQNKQLGINMIANIVAYSSNILIAFVLTPFLINSLGKETYGFYPIANTIVSYMSVLMNAMNTIASRFVTVSLVQKNKQDANNYFSSVLAANVILSLILIIPMVLFVSFLDKIMDVPLNSIFAIKTMFALVFSSSLVNVLASVFGIATFAKNRIDLRSLREIVTAVLKLVLFLFMYRFFTPSIIYVGVVALTVSVINVLFQVVYTKKLLPEIKIKLNYISWKHTKDLLTSSIWNVINFFGNALLAGITIILANMLYGASASGSFSIVQTVPQFICGIITMLVGVFYPVITYKYAQNNKSELIKEISDSQKVVGFFSCATIVVFSLLAKDFFALWTPQEDPENLAILSAITITPHIIIACMWSLTNLNVVMNKVKIPALFTLGLGICNIVFTLIIYEIWHPNMMFIAVMSTIFQIIWVGVFIPLYASYELKTKFITFYPPLLKALICIIPTVLIVLSLKKLIILDSWSKFIVFGGLMGLIGLTIFACGMLGIKNIKMIFNKILKKSKNTN